MDVIRWYFFGISHLGPAWQIIDLFLVTETVIASDIDAYRADATLVVVASVMMMQAVSFIRLRTTRTSPRRITRYAELVIGAAAPRIRALPAGDLGIWFTLPLEAHRGDRSFPILVHLKFVLCQPDSLEGGTFFYLTVSIIFSW